MTRHECRSVVMKLVFSSMDNSNFDYQATLNEIVENCKISNEDIEFIKLLYDSIKNNEEDLINKITSNLQGYEWKRVYKVDKCLLMMALAEITILNTPYKIVLNEIIELAKEYSTEKSPKFINGILSKFVGD